MPDGNIAVVGDLLAPADVDAFCSSHAEAIRLLGRRVVGDIIEIGQRLIAVRDALPDQQFAGWLRREFQGWSQRTAYNFIYAAEAFAGLATVASLDIDAGALYLLAGPKVPAVAREQAVAQAEAGDRITKAEAERLIAEAREAERGAVEGRIEALTAEIERLTTYDDEQSKELARTVGAELARLEEERDEARAALSALRDVNRRAEQRERRAFRVLTALRQLHAQLQAIAVIEITGTDEELLIACQQAIDIADWLSRFKARFPQTAAVALS